MMAVSRRSRSSTHLAAPRSRATSTSLTTRSEFSISAARRLTRAAQEIPPSRFWRSRARHRRSLLHRTMALGSKITISGPSRRASIGVGPHARPLPNTQFRRSFPGAGPGRCSARPR
jgi:hypothetical protein